jgi:hypothetical protein
METQYFKSYRIAKKLFLKWKFIAINPYIKNDLSQINSPTSCLKKLEMKQNLTSAKGSE